MVFEGESMWFVACGLPRLCGLVVTLPPHNLVDKGLIPKVGCLDHVLVVSHEMTL